MARKLKSTNIVIIGFNVGGRSYEERISMSPKQIDDFNSRNVLVSENERREVIKKIKARYKKRGEYVGFIRENCLEIKKIIDRKMPN